MIEIENALYCMKESAEIEVCEKCINYFKCDHKLQKHYAEMAVEALEKQIAMKPDIKIHGYSSSMHCPICKFRFVSEIDGVLVGGKQAAYCPDCGQKMDWNKLN